MASKKFYSKQGNQVTERKARIDHDCDQCDGLINAGDKYREIKVNVDFEDYYYTKRICNGCWQE
jgi:hypothetical protein